MGNSFQTYALRGADIVYIDDVERGIKCNCTCPGCGKPLIARKGQKNIHHFAHQSATCEYGYESSLHLAAKEILSNVKALTLPPTYTFFQHAHSGTDPLLEAKTISIDHVELEKHFESVIPDIVVYSNGKKLFVEIYVTHKIDEDKRKKIEELGISTIEIDLSSIEETITREELSVLLQDDCPEKKWIYNAWVKNCLEELLSYTEEKPITHRDHASHVDFCPLHKRDFHGKPYANFIDDCTGCKFYFGYKNGTILCSGASLVSTPQDLRLTFEERKSKQGDDECQHGLIQSSPVDQNNNEASDIQNNIETSDTQDNKETSVTQKNMMDVSQQKSENEKPTFQIDVFDKPAPVLDDKGWRWMVCTNCRSILRVDKMYSLGTPGNINKGICRECHRRKG